MKMYVSFLLWYHILALRFCYIPDHGNFQDLSVFNKILLVRILFWALIIENGIL